MFRNFPADNAGVITERNLFHVSSRALGKTLLNTGSADGIFYKFEIEIFI